MKRHAANLRCAGWSTCRKAGTTARVVHSMRFTDAEKAEFFPLMLLIVGPAAAICALGALYMFWLLQLAKKASQE